MNHNYDFINQSVQRYQYEKSVKQQCMNFGMITKKRNVKKKHNYAIWILIASQFAEKKDIYPDTATIFKTKFDASL